MIRPFPSPCFTICTAAYLKHIMRPLELTLMSESYSSTEAGDVRKCRDSLRIRTHYPLEASSQRPQHWRPSKLSSLMLMCNRIVCAYNIQSTKRRDSLLDHVLDSSLRRYVGGNPDGSSPSSPEILYHGFDLIHLGGDIIDGDMKPVMREPSGNSKSKPLSSTSYNCDTRCRHDLKGDSGQ